MYPLYVCLCLSSNRLAIYEIAIEYGVAVMDCVLTSAAKIVNQAVRLGQSPRMSGEYEYGLATTNWTRGMISLCSEPPSRFRMRLEGRARLAVA
jgi:hypothetical protein